MISLGGTRTDGVAAKDISSASQRRGAKYERETPAQPELCV